MKIIAAIQILIKLSTIGYGAGAVRTTGRFAAPAAACNSLARWLRTASESFIFSTSYLLYNRYLLEPSASHLLRSSYRGAMLCIYRLTSFMMGGYCDESKKRYQYSLCPVGHDCCRNCGLDHSDCPHTAHDGRLYQPSIPDWCFQRNRTHTMYYPQLYAKIAEETQLRLFFILWRAVNRKSLFTLTLILNFPFLSSSSLSAFQRYRPAAPLKAARPAGCHAILPDSRGSSRRSRAAR